MKASFRTPFDNPPHGNIQAGYASKTGTVPLTHSPPPGTYPNEVIEAPHLADDLKHWAQTYLDGVHGRVPLALSHSASVTSDDFASTPAGNQGAVSMIYIGPVKSWSRAFTEAAENLTPGSVRLVECSQVHGTRTDWKWVRGNETRLIVELKGRRVFENYSQPIRQLAEESSRLELDGSGCATGARSILAKLGVQMIANNCQLGILFGGMQFILLAMVDVQRDGGTVHQLQCSPILNTVSTNASDVPNAIQITIAALLSQKNAFFQASGLPVGISATTEDSAGEKETQNAGSRSGSARVQQKGKKGRGGTTGRTAQGTAAGISQVIWFYEHAPNTRYAFRRVDTEEADDRSGELVLFDDLGAGTSGQVFDADLQQGRQTIQVAAKFYDPATEELIGKNAEESPEQESSDEASGHECSDESQPRPRSPLPNEEKDYTFNREILAYARLQDTSIVPQFHGAFQGIGFTGLQTGLVITEKLPFIFSHTEDMTQTERQAAYEHVVELHRRGIHHGDVRVENFGCREAPVDQTKPPKRKRIEDESEDVANGGGSSVVIFDLSHSDVFDHCDPEKCWELRSARKELFGPEGEGAKVS